MFWYQRCCFAVLILAHWQCRSVNFHFLLQAYNIHVNGALHCRVRYSQLLSLHEQVSLQTLLELWSRNTCARARRPELLKCQDIHPARPFFHRRVTQPTCRPPDVLNHSGFVRSAFCPQIVQAFACKYPALWRIWEGEGDAERMFLAFLSLHLLEKRT